MLFLAVLVHALANPHFGLLYEFQNSVVFIFTICMFVYSVSGRSSLSKYDSSVSADTLAQSLNDERSIQLTVSFVSPSSKTKIKRHKTYEYNRIRSIPVDTIKLFSSPFEKSFWKFKPRSLMKKSRQASKYNNNIYNNIHGSDPLGSGEKNTKIAPKRNNVQKMLSRSRRQASLNVTETEAAPGDDAQASDFVGNTRPKPTPQPSRTEQYAIQKSETGQSQTQLSGATDTDQMTYNPDGSVKSHNLESSTSNKQEISQFQRSETLLPILGPVSTSALLGTSGTGDQNSLFTGAQLGPLPPLPEMQPMQQASTSRRSSRPASRNKTEKTQSNSSDRSLGGDYNPPGIGESDSTSKPKNGKSNPRDRSVGGGPDEDRSSEVGESTSPIISGGSPLGYQKSSSSSNSFSNSSNNSTSSKYGDAKPGIMSLDSRNGGVRMVMPVQQLPDLFQNFPMQSGTFGQFQPMGQGQFVQGQQLHFLQGQPGNFQQGQYGNVVQVYSGQFFQGQPGQFSQGQPGQFTSELPGQFPQGQLDQFQR
ncbi:unnamed protein product, partial [Allacma fusca]